MKTLITVLLLLFTLTAFAQETVLFEGTFSSLTPSVKVQGKTRIERSPEGLDYVTIENFRLRGGVVLDLKVCGEIIEGEEGCMSVAEPKNGNHSWPIPYSFSSYNRVIIFDLDLIQDLAVAR